MKRALALGVIMLGVFGCGGAAEPAKTAEAETPAAAAPVDATPALTDAAKPSPDAGEEGAWAGESEAKAPPKAAEGNGKTETRTMDVIAQIVKENRKPVRECFDKAKKDLPDLKGDMVIHFVVDPEGKVKKADLNQERSTLKSSAVVDCAIKVITGIKFPPSSRGMDTTVNYPFNLN
jgi:hypothetical protein